MMISCSERIWYQSAMLFLAFVPFIFLANQIDGRAIHDIGIWIKPLKFHFSAAVHLLTFAVLVYFLPKKTRHAFWLQAFAFVTAGATIFEIYLIDMQAFRGVQSHFNSDTQFDVLVYALMGIGALILSLPAFVLGMVFCFTPESERLSLGLKLGAASGLLLGFVLTLGIAGYMSTLSTGHWVSAPPTDSGGLPIVGWTRQGGDLRVAHFFATHMMQILPLAGFLLDKTIKNRRLTTKLCIGLLVVLWVGITLGTLIQALDGRAFIPF